MAFFKPCFHRNAAVANLSACPSTSRCVVWRLAKKQVARNLAIVPHPLPRGFVGRFIEAARWKGAWNGMFALADKTQNVIGMIGFRATPLATPVTADLVYAPKILGVYGVPGLMRHNKLVYNEELRDKLWSYTVNDLNLDI